RAGRPYAGADADRPRPAGRSNRRAEAGRRRLSGQAVRARGAAAPHPGHPAAFGRPSGPAGGADAGPLPIRRGPRGTHLRGRTRPPDRGRAAAAAHPRPLAARAGGPAGTGPRHRRSFRPRRGRPGHPPAPQDRGRPQGAALPADRARGRLHAGARLMRPRLTARILARWIKRQLPTSLFGRSLLIIILPIALMQIAVTFVFFDAHWETVTSRLSEGLAGDVAWAVESYEDDPSPAAFARLAARAEKSLSLSIALQPGRALPER